MKKRILAIIAMVCVAVFALTACGGGNSGGGNTGGGTGGNTGGGNETFNVGSFTVAVPSGWTAFPQHDIFGEEDANGNLPVDPDAIVLGKGAKDEFSALTGPCVRINYYGPSTTVMDSRGFYDNVQEIDGVQINGVDCDAFSGESIGYVYQFVTLKTDDAQYEISILSSIDGKDTGISWQDPDVTTIMSSLQKSVAEPASK